MNVCALDVIARTPDFESVASSLELRGWEWDLLHGADGEATLGDIARRMGVDTDTAIGFVHEALHRGLLAIATMSLTSYRLRMPMQTALASTPAPLSLGPATVAAPPEEPPAQTHGAISFSSDAFDWNQPDATFDDAESSVPVVQTPPATPGKTITAHVGGVHYDERFGVEHPDGPFAAVPETHDVSDVVDDPFAAQPEVEPFAESFAEPHHDEPVVAATHDAIAHADDPFSVEHEVEPFVAATQHEEPVPVAAHDAVAHVDDPFAVKHDAEPFVEAVSHDAQVVEDPFAVRAHEPEPVAETEHHEEPAVAASAIAFEASHFEEPMPQTHEAAPEAEAPAPVATAIEHDFGAESQPVAATNGHATVAEEPIEESAPGSISFSFSPDDPIDAHEATYEAPASAYVPSAPLAPPPVEKIAADQSFPSATTIEHHESVATLAHPESETQSTYFEREAIDTDASRELEEKSKNWKDSLSWREQQELNAAMETGKEKQGVIGSLLRALGVR